MNSKKIIYYSDELNDDFANITRFSKRIDDNYTYINKNFFWNIVEFVAYRLIMTPVAFLYCKIKFNIKLVNRKVIKINKKQGYFLYGNHTQIPGDGYIPTIVTFPKKPYVLVHPDSVALKGTEQFMLMIGAIPLPSTFHGIRNLMKAIQERINEGKSIMIYPEAHVWPYYTGIRPFSQVSFSYPVKMKVPAYSFTTVYKKRRWRRTPAMTVFVDGPFYPDKALTSKEQQEKLRNEIYNKMKERAEQSNCEYIIYRKKEET